MSDAFRRRGSATRSPVWARGGMVASAQPLASLAGVAMLKRGGTAVDAALAANAVLAVTEPTSCGLGGDLFALVWEPEANRLHGLNASGRAPATLSADRIPAAPDGTIPLHSPFAWTVPGCAAGWGDLHARFGSLPFGDVLAPAIEHAARGFPVSPVIAGDWERGAARFALFPGFAPVFMPGGAAPRGGDLFANPALARTLETLGREGAAAFYTGGIAETIARFSAGNGGFLSGADLAGHASTWEEPLAVTYRGRTVWELPPAGQGLAALQMLNMLEAFDLAGMGRGSADFWHLMVEVKKLAYADRARYYADPAFATVPVAGLLSREYARRRMARFDPARAAREDPPGDPVLDRKETTYLCAGDASGMMVSLIQSNYTGFGSGYVIPELGFGLQNRGALFSLHAGHPNRLEPGKRPFHTIIPGFATLEDGARLAFGVMGGDMQPQGHAQVLVNLLDFGMNLQEAGDAVRFHHTGSSEPTGTVMSDGGILHIEEGLPAALLAELARRGHRLEAEAAGAYGGYQAVWRDGKSGVYCGATEPRKDGCALGY